MSKKNKDKTAASAKLQRVITLEIKLDEKIFQTGIDATQYINSMFQTAQLNFVRALADTTNCVMIHPNPNNISYNNMARLSIRQVDTSNWGVDGKPL